MFRVFRVKDFIPGLKGARIARDILKEARFIWGVPGVPGVPGMLAGLQLSQSSLSRAGHKGDPVQTTDLIISLPPGSRIGIPPGHRSGRPGFLG